MIWNVNYFHRSAVSVACILYTSVWTWFFFDYLSFLGRRYNVNDKTSMPTMEHYQCWQNCICCKLHMLQISCVANCMCCILHMLQIAPVPNCTCWKVKEISENLIKEISQPYVKKSLQTFIKGISENLILEISQT